MGVKERSSSLPKGRWLKMGLLVQKAECLMDVKLFLEGQARWQVNSPHCLVLLHEMFQHASEQGQKEAEQMIC